MALFFGVVITVLLIAMAIFAIPVSLSFYLSWPQKPENFIRLRWFFGLVNVRPPLAKMTSGKSQQRNKRPAQAKSRPRWKSPGGGTIAQQRELLATLFRVVCRCWQAIDKKKLELKIRLGLDDPADTGMLWGVVSPLTTIFPHPGDVVLEVVPDFTDAVIELDGSGRIRFVPLQLIGLLLGFLLNPSVWRAFR